MIQRIWTQYEMLSDQNRLLALSLGVITGVYIIEASIRSYLAIQNSKR